ncbi:MAG: RNA-binding transcriptional accessory protein [Bacteroidetes bacterium]|nr:RNA-binding transcriptional accessory protein [Bacteroidota bacterium]
MLNYSNIIAVEIGVKQNQVEKTIELLNSGATIPFISRYRKELTGSLDEVQIANIRDRYKQLTELDKRREAILASIEEQGFMTPELEKSIKAAITMSELEDLYLPYKPKKKTRATVAIARGLEPLAKIIFLQQNIDVEEKALAFIDDEKGVSSVEDALAGARDIIAEWINENAKARAAIRKLFERDAFINSKLVKGKNEDGKKYENYFEYSEEVKRVPSHRILAMFRGENEGFLRISISPDEEKAHEILDRLFINANNEAADQVEMAMKDSYKRLMAPSIETEIRSMLKERADKEAIRVFADNLRQLLLASPLGQKNILAIDPGFRTGCKLVCLDKQGKLIHNETIYPHPPQNEWKQSAAKIHSLVNAYKIEAIAIGNGTAGRETESLVRSIRFDKDIIAVMVNESGASVYSASPVAREEFPDYDVTVRGAVSIGRRLADPLAELVKIDAKSIGVGQYQHDVDQKELKNSLDDVVVSCVNSVGVELNTASKELLTYVSGLGPALASKIVEFRNQNGPFKNRKALKTIPRFGDKAFEQSAGFLRVADSDYPLDKSAVHPESYAVVEKMAKKLNATIDSLIADESLRKQIKLDEYITDKIGIPTLKDIMAELARPGRDPREKFDVFEFDSSVNSINDVKPGMVLPGIVTNITAFGAFVDIGVHQDGLVHISNIADRYIKDPAEVLNLNQKVKVKVLDVDIDRKRINLSIKDV